MRAIRALALLPLLAAGGAAAQQVQVQVSRGPHYVGSPVEVEVEVEGFEETPQPEIEVPPPARGRLDLVGVSPNVSTSITIVNGRVAQTRDVRFVYRYRYLPAQPGAAEIGPFRVSQGGTARSAGPLRLDVRAVPESDRLRVSLSLPEAPLYVGARAPVTLEFWLERDLHENLHDYALQVPLFELAESFRLLDDPDGAGETEVVLQTAGGEQRLRGALREAVEGGRRFLVVSVRRTLLPLRAGRFEPEPASLVVEEGTSFRRNLFGERRATRVRKLRAVDRARAIEVGAVPAQGQPPSYAGAVGSGFHLEVAADRTVVQVGEPIELTFTLRGAGSLETAALPPLDAEGLLPPERFRVPAGGVPGVLEEGAKRFRATVRVLDEGVQEIPALAYSWFDPKTGRYETTRSRPIALAVRPGEVIGAEDVVSGERRAETAAPEPARSPEAAAPTGFALTGADLAIERDLARLTRPAGRRLGGAWLPAGVYAGSLLLVGLAVLDRRRQSVDPALARRRERLEAELRAVREAARLPAEQAVPRFARSLRRMLAEVPAARSTDLEAFLGECDARSYAPAELRAAPVDEAFRERALALAAGLRERAA